MYYDTGSSQWLPVVVGAQGIQGIQGTQSTQGTQGPIGSGSQGIQGTIGIQGDYGPINEIQVMDNLYGQFDGTEVRFVPNYQGSKISITNPFTLLVSLNGLEQKVSNSTVVWDSPVAKVSQVRLDDDGQLAFSSPVPSGTLFEGRVLVGSSTTALTTTYPFEATDLLMGAF